MATRPDSYTFTSTQAKKMVLKAIAAGATVYDAMDSVGKSEKTYEYYRKSDPEFREAVDRLRGKIAANGAQMPVPDFPEFSERYLHRKVFPHQMQWFDLLEGHKPRNLHPAMTYQPGEPDLLVLNTPPEHAKTTCITIDYTAWRICKDPNIKVIYVSKTREMAQKFLTELKGILTGPQFRDLQNDFGPTEGFAANSVQWTQTKIYLSDDVRTSNAKDPTVEALGIRGQIYGARADLIIIDDAVTGENAHEFDKQIDWIQGEVISRLSAHGTLLLVGTRMAPVDLYSEIRNADRYPDEECPWTYFAQPAVLEFAEDPKDWITLWPRCDHPAPGARGEAAEPDADGLYPKWDGPALFKRRGRMSPRKWAMVYMQQQVLENSTFPVEAVTGCIDQNRMAGPLGPGQSSSRPEGMAGLYVVAGLDPAMAGNTAAVVMGVDRTTRKRWVLDVFNSTTTPDDLRDLMKRWTEKYGIMEWRVEKNAFQIMLTQDREIRQFLASRGCVLKEHFTGTNKWDADFGVASMRDLFGTWKPALGKGYEPVVPALISFPTRSQSEPMKAMVEQLITWYPEAPKSQKTDCVMALWFPLDADTPVWTAGGWSSMRALRPGDQVATAKGDYTTVLATTPIRREPVFDVTFDDGSVVRATAEHRWWVTPVGRGSNRMAERFLSTAELLDPSYKRVMVKRPAPIDGPDAELPIDPYCLGAWLGDGQSQGSTMFAHEDDQPHMRSEFEKAGYGTTDRKKSQQFGILGMRGGLVELGVLNNKHIPEVYLRGSRQQRLALLQGLMDTDGTNGGGQPGRVYFGNANKNLVDGVAFLARSLGFRVNIHHQPAGTARNPQGGESPTKPFWRVLFTATSESLNPFRMPRKADRISGILHRRPRRYLTVKSVRPAGETEVMCITVEDGSHVFLAGTELVPTGNCEIRARELTDEGFGKTHIDNPYLPPRMEATRAVVDLDVLFMESQRQMLGAL